jgi:fluoride exporter
MAGANNVRRGRGGGARVPPSEVATGPARRRSPTPSHVLLVAAGGSIGALARVGLAELFPALLDGFPWTTFVENVSGAFALALLLTLWTERVVARPEVRLAVCTGALGAFTTYSALAVEVTARFPAGHGLLGVGYALASVLAGVTAALVGVQVARRWRPSTGAAR